MALSLSGERPAEAATASNPFDGIARWFATLRRAGKQRRALVSLLDYDSAHLDDLGLCRQDLIEALGNSRRQATQVLSAARAERTRRWYRVA